MPEAVRQLVLDLPVHAALESEDFLVGPSNAEAFGMIERWPDWPDHLMLLAGPHGSGKSHLAAIWAGHVGATSVAATEIGAPAVPDLAASKALVVEDIDRSGLDEHALFHLLNLVREARLPLLLTSSKPLAECRFRTPDLLSRLRVVPSIRLLAPDDALLRAVLVKLFHDRQIAVEASVVDYVAMRIERSLAAAGAVVDALDREALSRGRRLTRPVAAAVLAGHPGPVGEPDDHPSVTPRS